jgi:hypothetical protein
VDIEPPAEFAADFFQCPDHDKAEALIEMAAGFAPFSDASQKRVKALAEGFGDNRRLQRAADTPAAIAGFDIERRFGRLIVGWAVGETSERGPTYDLAGEERDQDRIAPAMFPEPILPLGQGLRLDVECGRRCQDRLVIDLGNRSEIARFGDPDFDGRSLRIN